VNKLSDMDEFDIINCEIWMSLILWSCDNKRWID